MARTMILALLARVFFLGAPLRAEAPLVWLDPGHGGSDRGARAPGFEEAAFSLELARKVEARLEAAGIRVALSRSSDLDLSPTARVQSANQVRPDAAVSLHANSSFSRSQGCRVFIPWIPERGRAEAGATRWDRAQGLQAAASRELGKSLASGLSPGGRGPQSLPLAIFRGLAAPAAEVECGFSSDAGDLKSLTGDAALEALAGRIAQGILAFLNQPHGS